MRVLRTVATVTLILIAGSALLADLFAPQSYAEQFREAISVSPSHRFPLGTDELGRDRFARLLYGTRVSILLAPAAALLSTFFAAIVGCGAAVLGGRWERAFASFTDTFISLPWLFLLLTVRALLPLSVSPVASVIVTFGLLGLLGWPTSARVIRAAARGLLKSDFLLQARAGGNSDMSLLVRHMLPNLRPILLAQFWISIPVFILGEVNLSLLGLGVAEPLPSWGSLLRELQNFSLVSRCPWMLMPAVLLVLAVSCFQIVLRSEEAAA